MSEWLPSLNALRAFEAVTRHLSYQGAADELRVTPAAVKQLVSKLEDALGVRLVERQGRHIALTATGHAGKNDLGLAMRHTSDAVQKMRRSDTGTRLIVTVEASFATAWLVPKLEAFRKRHPKINVLIDSSQKIIDLKRSEVDVAIRYGVHSDGDLIVTRLFEDRVFPACSPALAKGPPELTKIEQLQYVPLIHWDMSDMTWASATRRWYDWEEWIRHVGVRHVDTARGLRFNDYGLAVQAATSGQGVILASWPMLRDPFDAGLLVRPFPESVLTTGIGYDLVTTPESGKRPEVVAFTEWLTEMTGKE